MTICVDKLRNWGWRLGPSCHLITDGPNEELHIFAAALGLKREWFQTPSSGPHYDLTASKRRLAVQLGAIELEDRLFHEILTRWIDAALGRLDAAETEEERDEIKKDLFR